MLDKKTIAKIFGFESVEQFNAGVANKLGEGKGGDETWGANCNVSLNEKQKYVVILRGAQKLSIKGMSADELSRMANNLEVCAIPVTLSKGHLAVTGTPFAALVGGRALCQAGISDANSKDAAMQNGTPILLSFISEFIPEEKRTQRQKDNDITTKKIYSASKLTAIQEEDLKATLAAVSTAPAKGK